MRNKYARLAKIRLKNVKNVINGEIEFENTKNFNPFDKKNNSSIFAVYGSNASGKTTAVESISVMHELIMGNKLKSFVDGYITEWEKNSRSEFSFVIEGNNNDFYLIEYFFSFVRSNQEDRPILLLNESLSAKKATLKGEKWGWKKCIADITIDYSNSKKIFEEATYDKFFSKASLIGETKTLCKNDLKSLFFSKEFFECLANKKTKSKDILGLREILHLLKKYATFDLFVFSNDDASISYLNSLVICDRQENESHIGAGKMLVNIEKTTTIGEKNLKVLQECLKSINDVLPSVVSNLKIEISSRGEELDKDGNVQKKIDLFSVRDDKRIPLKYESAGIKKMVAICGVLINVYNNPSVALIVDELDSGIFEYLLGLIVRAFDHHAKGQIVFTAHNSRALELLPTKQVIFTTTNPNNRFIKMKKVKPTNNLRDFYYRAILLGGQDEALSPETSESKIAKAFTK